MLVVICCRLLLIMRETEVPGWSTGGMCGDFGGLLTFGFLSVDAGVGTGKQTTYDGRKLKIYYYYNILNWNRG